MRCAPIIFRQFAGRSFYHCHCEVESHETGVDVMAEVPHLVDKRPPLTGARVLARFVFIGAVLVAVAGAFAYVGGWLSPNRLTQIRMIAAFESASGDHPGFRHHHAKGLW